MRPTPAPGSSSLDPVHNFTRFKKSTGFCVELGDDVGLCAPRPHQGVPPWTRYTMGLGFKKSAFFCVEQKKRMSCSIPRQRLSVRSGPGQLVDRGFSDDRHRESLLSRMRFIPKTAPCRGEHGHNSRNPMFHAETFCTTRQLSSRNGGAGESFPCFGVWGRRAPKDFPARRPP